MAEIPTESQSELQNIFQPELLPDEKILWKGKGELKLFTPKDFFLLPIWLIVLVSGLEFIISSSQDNAHFLMLFSIPILLLAFYALCGRFFFKLWKQRNTYYAVTDQRALIVTTAPMRSLQAVLISTITIINKSVNTDGTGTISFGNSHPQAVMWANTGMDSFAARGWLAPAFYDIKDVNAIYLLINQQRKMSKAK